MLQVDPASPFIFVRNTHGHKASASGQVHANAPWYSDVAAGFVAGCCSRSITAPVERVKTELQLVQGKEAGSIAGVSYRVWQQAGAEPQGESAAREPWRKLAGVCSF